MANAFESELRKAMASLNWWCYKLPIPMTFNTRASRKVPFDFLGVCNGKAIAIEAKMLNTSQKNFPFSRVKFHQQRNLLKFNKPNNPAFILICLNFPNYDKCYAVSVKDWLIIKKEAAKIKRKSIPIQSIQTDKRFVEIPKIKVKSDMVWNLNLLGEL